MSSKKERASPESKPSSLFESHFLNTKINPVPPLSNLSIRRIDAYLIREILPAFILGIGLYSFLFIVNLILQVIQLMVEDGLPLMLSAKIFLLGLPNIFLITIPMGLLAGYLLTFSRLSSDSEIIALRASGIPVRRLLRVPILIGIIVTFVCLIIAHILVPFSRSYSDSLLVEADRSINLIRLIKPGAFFDKIPDLLIYAKSYDNVSGSFKNIIVFQRNEGTDKFLSASEGTLETEGGAIIFNLKDGYISEFDRKNPKSFQHSAFQKQILSIFPEELPEKKKPGAVKKALMEMNYKELKNLVKSMPVSNRMIKEERASAYAPRYEMARRTSMPLTALIFALIAVPLGIVSLKGGKGSGLTISLIIVLFYWIFLSALSDLAIRGLFNPYLAAYLPNIILLIIGFWLLLRRDKLNNSEWLSSFFSLFSQKSSPVERKPGVKVKSLFTSPISTVFFKADLYIFKFLAQFITITGASLLLITFIIEMRANSEYIRGGRAMFLFIKYLLYSTPSYIEQMLPLAILMSILICFGILDRKNELTAFKASGVSVFRLGIVPLFFGIILSFFLFVMGESVMPGMNRKAIEIKDNLRGFEGRWSESFSDVWVFSKDKTTLYNYRINSDKRHLKRFSIFSLDPQTLSLKSRYFTKSSSVSKDGFSLKLKDGWFREVLSNGGFSSFTLKQIKLKDTISYLWISSVRQSSHLTARALSNLINEMEAKGHPTTTLKIDYYKKYAINLTPLILAFFAIPFALRSGRKGTFYGVALALIVSIIFYITMGFFSAVGEMGWLPPLISVFAPHILFSLIGGYLFLTIRT